MPRRRAIVLLPASSPSLPLLLLLSLLSAYALHSSAYIIPSSFHAASSRRRPRSAPSRHVIVPSPRRIAAAAAAIDDDRVYEYDKRALSTIPVVICPGFGNDMIDYINPLGRGEEYGLVSSLVKRGFSMERICIVPIKRYDWLRVGLGLFDIPNFYKGKCRPDGLGYGWYVARLRRVIERAYSGNDIDGDAGLGGGQERGRVERKEKVLVIGHSAGGWLARAALGEGTWDARYDDGVESYSSSATATEDVSVARASDRVRALITIGAIHSPPRTTSSSSCVTRGALAYVDANYPGAYHSDEGISYVSVGGDAIIGRRRRRSNDGGGGGGGDDDREEEDDDDDDGIDGESSSSISMSASYVAYTSYEAVGGYGETTGDGVVPLEYTLLDGSRTIILDGVLHSINEAGTTEPTDRWYGSEDVIDRWLYDSLVEAGIVSEKGGSKMEGGRDRGSFMSSLGKIMDMFST